MANATAAPAPTTAGGDPAVGPLVVDPALLAILPASIGGVQITAVPETAASLAADPSLGTSASGVAVGLALTAPESPDENLAVATVIRLRRGVYSEGFFNGWRIAYDDAACAPAGGVSTRVDQVIGLKTVRVTACREGARTYHVHLAGADDILVSVTSLGDGKFGDLVITGLRQ